MGSGPKIIIVMGRVGSGKSTVARQLAESLGWVHLASDQIRKSIAEVPLYQRSDEKDREILYANELTQQTYEELKNRAVENVRHGQGVVLDATYSKRINRTKLRNTLIKEKIEYFLIELNAPPEVIIKRLLQRDQVKQEISDARVEDYEMLNQRYEVPGAEENANHLIVEAETPVETTTFKILKGLIDLNDNSRMLPTS